jgi:hypothetical protein
MRASEPAPADPAPEPRPVCATLASKARISGHTGRLPAGPVYASTARRSVLVAVIPPALRGVVVVRAGVGHRVRGEAVRQMNVRALAAEAELHHLHPRHSQFHAQRIHFRGDQPQVLGKQRQRSQRRLERPEKLPAQGAFTHLPFDRRLAPRPEWPSRPRSRGSGPAGSMS